MDEFGNPKEIIHVSANPKYGSEKKGAPTSYFMIAAPERIRVNCDLRHVNVVLCCDPKAFTHTNPLDGMAQGGSLVWESDEEGEQAWERLPLWARKQIIDKNIRVFTLPGFKIAREATDRGDLQLRMQGNAFLGAFFAVSPMLQEFGITAEQFRDAVHKQYVKKFGKLGDAVVSSNMEVMTKGFELVREIRVGELEAADRSTLRGKALLPVVPQFATGGGESCGSGCRSHAVPEGQGERTPLTRVAVFDAEFRSDYGYDQPASPLAALGVMAAGSGDTASKYVARRETPLYIPENCTQCMECIAVCPDTALPNCSQDLGTVLQTAISNYVSDASERQKMLHLLPEIEKRTRDLMREGLKQDPPPLLPFIIQKVTNEVERILRRRRSRSSSTSSPRCRSPTRRPTRSSPRPRRRRPAAAASSRSSSPTSARAAPRASPRAASTTRCGWCRRPKRSTRSTRAAPRSSICCRTRRRSTSASTTTRGRRTRRPPRCATC